MAGWLNATEALAYFGLGADVEELERMVIEHGIDVDVDDEGKITRIDAEQSKAALFIEHERRVGYRPDDEAAGRRHRAAAKAAETRARNRRLERRKLLEDRVAVRPMRGAR